jgi:predicted helicase
VKQLPLIGFDALAHEAAAVNEIKRHKRFTVVIGNPPYAGISSNNSDYAVRLVDAYKVVDGEALGEKKLWLQDDYVKFIRLSQMRLNETGVGVLGFITNHGFLDNPTFRGMRQSLMGSFLALHILDLHGNANKGERAPDGGEEQNVFEIKQGVAVTLGVAPIQSHQATVDHFQLWGLRAGKYKWLAEHAVGTTTWARLAPTSPYRFFIPRNQDTLAEYQGFFPLEKMVRDRTVGMITARDALTIQFTRDDIVQVVKRFSSLSVKEARTEFELGKDARDWSVERAQEDLRIHKLSEKCLRRVLYRPFDVRHTFYTGTSRGFIGQPQKRIMAHLDGKKNWALCISRFNRQKSLGYFFVTRTLTDFHLLDTVADSMTVFPLYLSADASDQHELSLGGGDPPNFAPEFLATLSSQLKIAKRQTSGLPAGLTPEDIFHYAYAVFHSPGYRSRYAEFLKIDFPRLLLTGNLELFRALARLGGELTALHLLESPRLAQPITEFIGGRNPEVEKVSWSRDTVWVDKAQTTGFRGVREPVWNFHVGGYQVCEKWLKDRKGRTLSKDDIAHYQKIVVALSETIRLMKEIDEVIEQYGGWPGAFSTSKETASDAQGRAEANQNDESPPIQQSFL